MEALGFIETKGLIAAVESADAMLKAAEVTLIEKTYVGGGLVSVAVSGGVAAVKAAVDAGAAAVKQINGSLLISQHVIPRPSEEIDCLIGTNKIVPVEPETSLPESSQEQVFVEETVVVEPKKETVEAAPARQKKANPLLNLKLDDINKTIVDKIVKENGFEKAEEILDKLKVTKLRNLAREYKKFHIMGREISKADKKKLLEEFMEYYRKI